MAPKRCLATFVNNTIIRRHGSLVSPTAEVSGDKIVAVIEVRHDGTRAAKIPRMIGVDTITVKNGKIVSFSFKQDPNDQFNKRLAAFYVTNPQAAAPPAE
jgi:hypothetical protein